MHRLIVRSAVLPEFPQNAGPAVCQGAIGVGFGVAAGKPVVEIAGL
jgi:hypothetical protein